MRPKDSDQPSLQDLLDLAADQGDWQLEAMIKLQLENELDTKTPPALEQSSAATDYAL